MDIKCPKCHKDSIKLYDYELTDDSHIIMYFDCDECHTPFEVYCELTPITITERK